MRLRCEHSIAVSTDRWETKFCYNIIDRLAPRINEYPQYETMSEKKLVGPIKRPHINLLIISLKSTRFFESTN